ncbi:cholinephosphotransferase 1 isoform X2 [Bactrocera neohumeralis]|uniref:cholinephosphotransferase 1 isoform X2 n=1 Tax=Bactrocera neohumeralis TaxID=98809 RepID=UPI00216641BB|nr:cholinephosphotransferase 1 isoform X2 [Bactrocera neohumeralis]XP_050326082.1 cholinephosphotransferase 1 isoform X2 [Bactrocera neohumeralis]XP_050326083.1 cholinephosphotransferase 1 isoform X2 [Bactrocera neohumeralis]XP_050326084.1 cholinephosphotransferase 1 isoform X2 [Bactrocera neohumeralis]XP_050326085.1 cholinephosphotransferase 1 isoform X2 [Bactrocera neohumeralis]
MSSITYKERVLSAQQLKKLSEHKYSCTSSSLLDPWLQPWWNWLVSMTPLWLAPNLITIIGLIVNIVTTLILVSYSPDGKSAPPGWASLLCAFGLFVYQSLDSIDGKQARRTNTQSPLGELFDHGCDSISTVFVALSACISCQLGQYPNWLFFQCFCAIGLFYCAHWQTYVSGTLRFGKIDVTEAQFTIMAIHIISAVFGSDVWQARLPLLGCEARVLSLYLILGIYILFVCRYARVIMTEGCGKNGSSVAGTSVLSPSIPLTMVILPALIIAQKSPQNIFTEHASLYILAFGMVAAKVTNKLVIAHMTKAEMEYLDWSQLGPALLFFNQYFNCVVPEIWLLWFSLFWGTQDLIRYCSKVCLEICNHLHINLFTIPYAGKNAPQTVSQGTSAPTTSMSMSATAAAGASAAVAHDKNGGTHHRKTTRQASKKQQQQH